MASKPSFSKPSGSKLQTTHLRLVPGEAEVFSASDKDGCWWLQNEVGSFLISQGWPENHLASQDMHGLPGGLDRRQPVT